MKTLTVAEVLGEVTRQLEGKRDEIVAGVKGLQAQLSATRLQLTAAAEAREAADRIRTALEEQLASARAANVELRREREALALRASDLELRLADVPPCGGRRCWKAEDGTWIHSSKSYGSCSVRAATAAGGEQEDHRG
jgi:hypothetical protein